MNEVNLKKTRRSWQRPENVQTSDLGCGWEKETGNVRSRQGEERYLFEVHEKGRGSRRFWLQQEARAGLPQKLVFDSLRSTFKRRWGL